MEWQSSYVKKNKKQDKLTSCIVTILTLPLLPSPSFCQSLVRPPLSALDTFLDLSGESMCQEIFWRSTDNFDIWFKHVFWQNVNFFFLHLAKKVVLSVQNKPLCPRNLTGRCVSVAQCFSWLIYPQKLPTSKRNFISWASFPNLTKKPSQSLFAVMVVLTKTLLESKNSNTFITEIALAREWLPFVTIKRKRFGFLSCFNELDER